MAPSSVMVLNGNVGLLTSRQILAMSGATFVVSTPSPGTGVAYAQLTSFSATANGLFVIANNNSAASKVNILLDRLDLFETAAVATGTALSFEVYNETGIVAGTTAVATRTPVQLNTALPQTTGAVVQAFSAGAITIPAAVGTRRLQGQAWIPTGVNVVNDTLSLDFGADGPAQAMRGNTAARATDTSKLCGQMNAIIIPPQTTSWINMWGWGTATPSFEYALYYNEVIGL